MPAAHNLRDCSVSNIFTRKVSCVDVVIDIAWLRIYPVTITTANIHPPFRPAHRPLPRQLRGRADGRAQPGEGVLHR